MNRLTALAAAAAFALVSGAAAAADNWPQWRGPAGQGVSTDERVPTEWRPDRNILWKTALPGQGHSSPVVWGDRIFLTAVVEGEAIPGATAVEHEVNGKPWVHPESVAADRKHTFRVLALDARSGGVLWDATAYDGPVYDARHRRSSFASPTVATDGRIVLAYFGPEGLYAYDVEGRLRWKRVEKFATMGLAAGTSPILFENLAIVQRDDSSGRDSAVIAYDTSTGAEVWRTRRDVQVSWATPVLVEAGRTELITSASEHVIAYDPRTGRELWRTRGVESNAIHTPLVGHGLVFVTAGYPEKRVLAVRPGAVPDDQRIAWEYTKGTGYVVSNILYGDYLYLVSDAGIVTCLEPRTGAVTYEGGRVPVPARFMASPVAFRGFVAITSEEGETFLVRAGPRHEIVRTNSVDEAVFSSPAIANGRIYIRGGKHLFAIGS